MKSENHKDGQVGSPETRPKTWITGGIGGAIGAAIGGYAAFLAGNYLYAGLGAAIGILIGNIAGLLLDRRLALKTLQRVEGGLNVIQGLLSLLLAMAGLTAFLLTGEWIGLLGLVFFGMGGIYLIFKPRLEESNGFLALMSLILAVSCLAMMAREKQIGVLPAIGTLFFGVGFIIFLLRAKTP